MAPAPEMDNTDDQTQATKSIAQGRSRREKKDKSGKFAAFEKLKRAKERGEKNKYELEEEKAVYDIVDEDNYSEIVRQRQEDDWIIDDDGAGYVEDGREIFDDDMDDDTFSKNEKKKDGDKKKNKNIVRPGTKPKANIKSMFAAASMVTKKKPEKDVTLANDDLLGDLMEELHKGSSQSKPLPVKINKNKAASKEALNPFSVKPLQPRNIKRELDNSSQKYVSPTIKVKKQCKPESIRTKPEPARVKKEPVEVKQEPIEEESPLIEEFDTNMDDDDELVLNQNGHNDLNESGMELNDIDFNDEVEDVKPINAKPVKKENTVKSQPVIESKEFVSSGWESIQSDNTDNVIDIQVDSSKLPLVTNEEGEQVMRFYWLDAYEDPWKQPGIVYLFGKVWIESAKSHVSCCVTVKNIQRHVYLLPRKTRVNTKTGEDTGFEVNMVDVYTEFNDRISEKHKIMKFKSMVSSSRIYK
ncbi:hypothetical protein SNE40_001404 [Patella caerulea]|uniref:DNA polymerase alpha catalytic subunit N-terminal domain-containing protein n=1 Tax=Patella caerulea TaxID=87958 RepID=A0AAN8KIK8_PATCE